MGSEKIDVHPIPQFEFYALFHLAYGCSDGVGGGSNKNKQ